jgi:2-keto-4-pentenoate hydratase/2-oxohepta-3-ene-1,7-dioic acid hydratase in catechol pathway
VHKGIVFFQNVDAIVGPEDDIVYPEGLTKELDYELELAIVVGRTGKWFDADEAAERYVAGYTVFNDITARDIQRREMQSGVFSFSKGIDTFCPIGPWIVTADEIPDPQALAMELRVNGEVRQRGNTDDMLISIPHLVAYHSPQGYSAGDLITTGTISGVAAIQPNPFDFYLQPGDVVEAEIADVGLLRNTIVPWSAAHDTPPYAMDLYA